jgi:hypothetical protein
MCLGKNKDGKDCNFPSRGDYCWRHIKQAPRPKVQEQRPLKDIYSTHRAFAALMKDFPPPDPPIIEHDVEVGEEKKDDDDQENNDETEDEDDKENNDDTEDEDDQENQEPDTNECRLYIEQTLPSQVESLFQHAHNRFRMNDLRLLELKNKYVTLKIRISQERVYPYWANIVPIRAVDSGPIRAIDIVSVGFNVACRGQKGFDTIIRTLTPLSKRYQLPIRVECVVNPSFAQYFRVSDKYVAADLYQFGGGDSYYLKETLPGQF